MTAWSKAEKPDRLSVSELLLLARQFFALHALLGAWGVAATGHAVGVGMLGFAMNMCGFMGFNQESYGSLMGINMSSHEFTIKNGE